jgi:hypothetical protein
MKHQEFAAMGKKLLPDLPGFVVKGPMILKAPIGDILYALHFDGSDFDARAFYIEAFFMPFFAPTEFIYFTFGKRLGGEHGRWNADSPTITSELSKTVRAEAVPFFESNSTISGIVEFLRSQVIPNARGLVNPHCQEALAYTLAKMGNSAAALVVIDRMHEMLSKSSVGWELEIKARSQLMREKLLQGPEAAQAQLGVWKDETIRRLKLENYCG